MPRLTRALAVALACIALSDWTFAAEEARPKPLQIVVAHGPGGKDLQRFAQYAGDHYRMTFAFVEAEKSREDKTTPFSNLDALADADVIVSNLYRTAAPPDQLDKLQQYFKSKPVVGLRKAHHGFQNWLEADQEVFGADYRGHYFGKNVSWRVVDEQQDHPIVKGLKDPPLPGGGLYNHTELAPDTIVLMTGGPEDKPAVPQTWTRVNKKTGQRAVYMRWDPKDLENQAVRDMLLRAIAWTAEKDLDSLRKPPPANQEQR